MNLSHVFFKKTAFIQNQNNSKSLKMTQNVAFEFLNFGIFTDFCPIRIDLSGNTA